MSALATRFRKIQLDVSPSENGARPPPDAVKPARLDFGDAGDKENVRKGARFWGKPDDNGAERTGKDALEETAGNQKFTPAAGERVLDERSAHCHDGVVLETELNHSPLVNAVSEQHVASGNEMMSFPLSKEELEGEKELPASSEETRVDHQLFVSSLQKILDGKHKWPWLERCKAMSCATEALTNEPTARLTEHTDSVLSSLSSKLNDHLDELRPSVITSALGLVNAIVPLTLSGGAKFAEEIFPSVLDLACGRSLTAQEAAKSLALLLAFYPEQEPVLEEADNIDRLCEILVSQADSITNPESRKRASSALKMAEKIRGVPENSGHPPLSVPKTPKPMTDSSPAFDEGAITRDDSPRVRAARLSARLSGRLAELSAQNSARRLHRNSVQLSNSSRGEGSQTNSPSSRVADTSVEVRNGATVIRNAKLRASFRNGSPSSARKQKMYSQEEMEDQRKKASEVVSQEASIAHEKEKAKLLKDKEELQHKLKAEASQVVELKSVLEEYQLTMNTMVAQGNSKISAHNNTLVNEKNRLKAELLEVTDSFETLKEKYDDSKKTVELFEAKENRYIEQIKDLKRNMVELQKWSNDLKANTEKKLSKAFESVTSYRASYIDKEAHAKKAISDLQRTRTELEREQQSHAETAAKFAQVEAQLHSEQDSRSSAEASLTTTKASLSRTTSEKERLRSELDSAKDSLSEVRSQLVELENAASQASETQSQLDSIVIENQTLKARAYDDMTQIKSFEAALKEKDAELEEMSAICEEAMERLERGRVGEGR